MGNEGVEKYFFIFDNVGANIVRPLLFFERNFFLMSVDFMVDKLIFWCYNLCSFRNKEAKYMDSCDNRSSFGDGQGLKKQMSL